MPVTHRISRLAACVAAAFALPAILAGAATTTLTVTSCLNSGGGTLRDAVAQANTLANDVVIDLAHLNCSAITLTTGALASTKDDLVLQGPGAGKLTLRGTFTDRVITHNAGAPLFVYDLGIYGGKRQAAQAKGGCIYSSSGLTLVRTNVSSCEALGTSGAEGGALYAKTLMRVQDSTVDNGLAYSSGGQVHGGALYSAEILLFGSTVSNNYAQSAGGFAFGGGVAVAASGVLTATGSTVYNNRADEGGGIFIGSNGSGTIKESTISGNTAFECGGGVYSKYAVTLSNSTIAFNRARKQSASRTCAGGGLYSGSQAKSVTLNSTIIAHNVAYDSSSLPYASDFYAVASGTFNTIAGASDLVVAVDAGSRAPPSGTLRGDPKLQPLRGNGGHTRTHAILSTSPAINHGSNPNTDPYDQRGTSVFPRAIGVVDIGAFEFNPDVIFVNGME